mmetsp:Transcript_21158/g.31536  ORF Transcript_21158/g.31536 Transcript_21158/m.31536 type:complete len:183 (-) Transcript_21158:161-709(-)
MVRFSPERRGHKDHLYPRVRMELGASVARSRICCHRVRYFLKLACFISLNMRSRFGRYDPEFTENIVTGEDYTFDANIVELNKHIRKHAIEEATKFMQDTAKKAKAMGFTPHELKLVNGSPTTTIKNAILDYTEKFTPDMLVCGSRGMGAMGRMFLGSVSDYLMHNCKCTVVVVKSPPAPKK